MSLAIGFILLVIFLCIMIFYLIVVLRDVAKVVDDVAEVVDRVHATIVEPLKAVDYIFDRAKPYIEMAVDKRFKMKKKKKK